VLSDDELQALRDIERRLRWHSPQLVQLFNSVEPQSETTHHQRARTRMILAAAALTGLTLLGPRMLNETEIRTQRRAPLPHTAEADTPTARRTDPVSGPAAPAGSVAIVDTCLAPSTMFATPPAERPDDSPTFRARAHQRIPTTQARAELETK
jgi:Protein of unknown function (DUF3040)